MPSRLYSSLGLGLGLDLRPVWLLLMRTYLYRFPLHCHTAEIPMRAKRLISRAQCPINPPLNTVEVCTCRALGRCVGLHGLSKVFSAGAM